MGGRLSQGGQVVLGDKADIAVARRLAPGETVLDVEHPEQLAEQQLVPLLGHRMGGLAQGGGRDRDLPQLGSLVTRSGDHALQDEIR